ncbi:MULTISPECIES: hypothetical protein [Vibrio]|uniref:hypothetical protein n=1 Tax=Vibrio TaxID=662 RepID=UPI0002E81592|nr:MULTISPECIES: hypothetical protein [Vibrio]OCH50595.1 hypothetical protein A6D97_05305 [Vibrio sp. ZF57]OED75678.1 hypothetical protein A141_06735 [Vibrio crassostreae ZF-91]OEF06898.1 hypothetical protein A138_11485 [Vibrio crassostreae 9ZC77]
MKVKELINALTELDPEMEVIGFTEDGDKFNDAKRVYQLKKLSVEHAYREKEHLKNIDATLNFSPDGKKEAVLFITSDF